MQHKMKTFVTGLAALLLSPWMLACSQAPVASAHEPSTPAITADESAVQERLIIHHEADKTVQQSLIAVIHERKLPLIYKLDNLSILVVSVPANQLADYMAFFNQLEGVLLVSEDEVMTIQN